MGQNGAEGAPSQNDERRRRPAGFAKAEVRKDGRTGLVTMRPSLAWVGAAKRVSWQWQRGRPRVARRQDFFALLIRTHWPLISSSPITFSTVSANSFGSARTLGSCSVVLIFCVMSSERSAKSAVS